MSYLVEWQAKEKQAAPKKTEKQENGCVPGREKGRGKTEPSQNADSRAS